MPVFRLRQVMRITEGLEDLSNVFYASKLIPGPGTTLDDPSRNMSKMLRTFFAQTLPKLTVEPQGLVYPISRRTILARWPTPSMLLSSSI